MAAKPLPNSSSDGGSGTPAPSVISSVSIAKSPLFVHPDGQEVRLNMISVMFAAAGLCRTPMKIGSPLASLVIVKVPSEVAPLNACMAAVYVPVVSACSHAPAPTTPVANVKVSGPVPSPVELSKAHNAESPPFMPVPEVVQLQFGLAGQTTATNPFPVEKLPVMPISDAEVALKPLRAV